MTELRIQTARVFKPLLTPARDKAAWGGRGSGKSHFFAGKLVEDSLAEPGDSGEGLRSVCIREVQKDLAQSSKALIEAKIKAFGLTEADGFKIFRDVIQTPKDGIIIFKGMQDYTADSIKSLEGFKRAWWEEAQGATQHSINLLRPTIRAPGSERWWSWNPRRKVDPVDIMFRGPSLPTGAVVVEANWRDNPWFTAELEQERSDCERMNPDEYEHIWEGDYVKVTSGAYYARVLTEARNEGRIGRVAADPLMRQRAFWDIGGAGKKADHTAIWIAQFVGRDILVTDYYEAQGQPLSTHVGWLREHGHGSALCVLPHDGANAGPIVPGSFADHLRQAEFEVQIISNQGTGAAMRRVNTARRLFSRIWIDEKKCEAGLEALGAYHAKKDDKRLVDLGPEHDWASHGADAFGLMCVAYEEPSANDDDEDFDSRDEDRGPGGY
jgi:phage terminase large subunit